MIQILCLQEPTDIAATYPELMGGLLSLLFCCWYYAKKHWLANNVLGICFSVEGIEHLSLGSVQTGAILLSGLFFYDIFWVFCTPVMVSALHMPSSDFSDFIRLALKTPCIL